MQCDYIIHQLLLGLLSDQNRVVMMPESHPLWILSAPLCILSAELNLEDRILGEVEKNSFITLPGKGGHSGLMTSKTACPHPGDLVTVNQLQAYDTVLSVALEKGLNVFDLV